MASGMELATAYVSILPATGGLGKSLAKEFGQVEKDAEATGQKSGNKFTQAFGKWAKRGLMVGGAALGAVAGAALISGMKSAVDQQQGQAVLSGLYGDAGKAQKTLDDLRKVSSRSPLDYTSYQEAAASLAYAGVEGDSAVLSLENVGKAIVAAGGDSEKLGQATGGIMKAVNNGGIAMMDSLGQISESGVPILSGLAEHFGVGIDEVKKMASEGKVNITDVMSVMENATGDTFQKMLVAGDAASQTFGSQWKIAKDNIQVALGQVLMPLVEQITPMIQPMADALTDFIEKIPGMLDGIKDAVEWIKSNIAWLGTFAVSLGIAGAAAWVASGGLTAAGLAIKGVFLAISTGIKSIPVIGWIIAAIGLLVTALVYVFTQTEWGQKVWEKVWGAIKVAAAAVWDWIQGTLWPGILIAWDAIATAAIWMYENAIKPAWDGIKTAALAVWDWISGTLWPGIVAAWEGISGGATSMYEGGIKPAWDAVKGAIDAVWQWLSGTLWPGITAVWDGIVGGVQVLVGGVQAAWNGVKAAIGAVVGWLQTWVWPVIEMVIALIVLGFQTYRDALAAVWSFVRNRVIAPVVAWFQNTVWPIIQTVLGYIRTGFDVMRDSLKAAWAFIKNNVIQPVVSWFQNTAWPAIRAVIDAVKNAFNVMRDSLKAAWQFVKDRVINPVVTWFRDTVRPIFDRALEAIKTGFNTMRDSLKNAWQFIKDRIINPVVTWFRDTVKPLFDRATDGISDAFTNLKDSVKTAWEAIKNTAKAPIRFVVDTVINTALIGNFNKVAEKLGTTKLPPVSLPKGFARGGVLPGMSSFRDGDDQLVPMRRGEGVIVSEALRDPTSRGLIYAINRAALRGGGSLASMMGGGFAGGGILGKAWRGAKGLAGDALDKVLQGVDFVAEALSDPRKMFDRVYNAAVGAIPGAGHMVEMAKGAGKKVLDGVVDSVLGAFGAGSDADVGPMPAGASRSLGYAQSVARSMGLTMTSYRRPGARTAGSGVQSLHALGRAMDFSNSSGPTPQMMRFFNAMHPLKPTELLYSPANGRQWRRSGRQANTSGATRRGHFNHVHVGFSEGGVFDNGGLMAPGTAGINLTRKPEAVLSPGATKAYQAHAESLGRNDGALDLSASTIDAIADALASRPNVLQIGNRQAGQLAAAGAGARSSLGGRW